MTAKLPGIPSDTGERRRREIVRFDDRDQAYRLTEEALQSAGFEVERIPTVERDDRITALRDWRISGKPLTHTGNIPELHAIYRDPDTGNTVELGLTVNYAEIDWPFDWTGEVMQHRSGTIPIALATAGNHDSNQGDLNRSLMNLLGCAHFDAYHGTPLYNMPGYDEWEVATRAALDPILGREEVPASAE